jgi:hypothetical protein
MNAFGILATGILGFLILRISYLMVVDVRKRDWDTLAIHSVQITVCGLGLGVLSMVSG